MTRPLPWSALALLCLASALHAGVIEICKDSDPPGALGGLYSFTITGQAGTILVPGGACSEAFILPDGLAVITEANDPGSTLTMVYTFPEDRLIAFDPQTRSATVLIVPGDLLDPSNQTLVGFVNSLDIAPIPEPQTMFLTLAGLACCACYGRQLRRRSPQ